MKEMKETNNKCQQESDKKNIVIEKIQEELNNRRHEAEHHKQKSENIQKSWESEVNKAKRELKICNDNWERELNKTKSELKISKGKEREIRKEKLDYQKDYHDMKKKLKTQEEVVIALKKDNEEVMSKYTKLKDDKENEMNTSKATQEEPRPQKEGDEVKEDKNTVEPIIGAVGGWSETDREPPNTQKEEEIDQKRSNKGKKDFYDLKKKLKTQGEIVIALKKENEELTGLKEDYEELIGLKEDYVELLNKHMKLKEVKEKEKNTSKATQEEPRPQKEGDEVKEDNITVEPIIGAVGRRFGDQHQNGKERRK